MADNCPFKTPYGVYVNESTPVGSDEKPVFGYVKKVVNDLDDNGKKVGSHEEIVFEKTGSESISEFINSFEDTTDIKKIFERYQMGDVSVLSKRVGEYVDSVGCPETLLDAQLMLKNGDKLFNDLPASIKEKFNNDVGQFVQAAQDGTLFEKSGLPQQVEEDKKTISTQQDEITRLKSLLDEGGIKYE